MSRVLTAGTVVRHFKYGGLTPAEKQNNLYTYKIITMNAHDTDNYERQVVYQALYNNPEKRIKYGDVFVRRYTEFISEVDRKKYPLDKYPQYTQQYRFEPVEDDE